MRGVCAGMHELLAIYAYSGVAQGGSTLPGLYFLCGTETHILARPEMVHGVWCRARCTCVSVCVPRAHRRGPSPCCDAAMYALRQINNQYADHAGPPPDSRPHRMHAHRRRWLLASSDACHWYTSVFFQLTHVYAKKLWDVHLCVCTCGICPTLAAGLPTFSKLRLTCASLEVQQLEAQGSSPWIRASVHKENVRDKVQAPGSGSFCGSEIWEDDCTSHSPNLALTLSLQFSLPFPAPLSHACRPGAQAMHPGMRAPGRATVHLRKACMPRTQACMARAARMACVARVASSEARPQARARTT